MDTYALNTAALNSHQVEVYTANLLIQGSIMGSFTRTADLINRADHHNFTVQDVALASLGQKAGPKRIGYPMMVARPHIHMVTLFPNTENTSDPMLSGPLTSSSLTSSSLTSSSLTSSSLSSSALGTLPSGGLSGRLGKPVLPSHQPRRVPRPCYAFTSAFVISGLCHLMPGATIEQLIDAPDPFFHLTQVTVYLNTQSSAPWKRDLVMVNKALLQAIYTAELPPQQPQADAPQS